VGDGRLLRELSRPLENHHNGPSDMYQVTGLPWEESSSCAPSSMAISRVPSAPGLPFWDCSSTCRDVPCSVRPGCVDSVALLSGGAVIGETHVCASWADCVLLMLDSSPAAVHWTLTPWWARPGDPGRKPGKSGLYPEPPTWQGWTRAARKSPPRPTTREHQPSLPLTVYPLTICPSAILDASCQR